MKSGHASHQIGLDVDLWFEPMPERTLSAEERENKSAGSVLKTGTREVDPARFGEAWAAVDLAGAAGCHQLSPDAP